MTPENRISVTKAAKVAARDLLRLMKVNEHLSHVSAAQNRINEENKLYEEETARATKRIDVRGVFNSWATSDVQRSRCCLSV